MAAASAAIMVVCVDAGPLGVKAAVNGRTEERAIAVIFIVEIDVDVCYDEKFMIPSCSLHEVAAMHQVHADSDA